MSGTDYDASLMTRTKDDADEKHQVKIVDYSAVPTTAVYVLAHYPTIKLRAQNLPDESLMPSPRNQRPTQR